MLWVGYPRSYTAGRARPVQYVALHYTAGSEGPTSAENGVAYDQNRADGTSCHAFFDSSGPGLQEVPFGDRSHSAYYYGNEIGVHFEICGTIQTRAQWLDPTSLATLRTCAAAVAYACDTLGLARRRLTVAEVRAAYNNPAGQRPTGICDHAAITAAYGLGDHTDVGPEFPWDVFMQMVAGVNPSPGPLPPWLDEGEDMGASFGPIEILPDTTSLCIPPVEAGAADPRPAWFNVCNDTFGAPYGLRVFVSSGDQKWQPLSGAGVILVQSGERISVQLPRNTACITVKRQPNGGPVYAGPLTCCIERGAVVR